MFDPKKMLHAPRESSAAVLATEQYKAFSKMMNRPGEWRCTMYAMKPGLAPKVFRCDKPQEISVAHDINGRHYDSWEDIILKNSSNRKKTPLFAVLNGLMGTSHSEEELGSCRILLIDIDNHDGPASNFIIDQTVLLLMRRFEHDGLSLPYPTNSGRGIHLFWALKELPIRKDNNNLRRWKRVEKALIKYVETCLEDIVYASAMAVDHRVSDPCHLIRLPGSWNPNSHSYDTVLYEGDPETDIAEFEEFFGLSPIEPNKGGDFTNTRVVSNFPELIQNMNDYAESQGWALTGKRNAFLTIVGSCVAKAHPDESYVADVLLNYNMRFTEPQKEREVRAVATSCIRNQYSYSCSGAADRLGLSAQERQDFYKMTKARAWAIARATGKDTRVQNRRRDEASRKRKIAKQTLYNRMAIMRFEGMRALEIAKALGVPVKTVYNHWNRSLPDWYISEHRTLNPTKPDSSNAAVPTTLPEQEPKKVMKATAPIKAVAMKPDDSLFAIQSPAVPKKDGGLFAIRAFIDSFESVDNVRPTVSLPGLKNNTTIPVAIEEPGTNMNEDTQVVDKNTVEKQNMQLPGVSGSAGFFKFLEPGPSVPERVFPKSCATINGVMSEGWIGASQSFQAGGCSFSSLSGSS